MKRDGRLVARYVRAIHGSGAYAGMKPGQASIGGAGTAGPYRIDHTYMEALQVYTNTVPADSGARPARSRGCSPWNRIWILLLESWAWIRRNFA